ncbi:MAG: DUF4347 domain-containing protein, partial [Geitlerinemataceae cyanobacterium]
MMLFNTSISLVVFDARVPFLTQLLRGLAPNATPYVLDANRDGLVQIGEILQDCAPVRQLHIVSHGAPGRLYLGNGVVTAESLTAAEFWRENLAADAEISLYGCDVARDDVALLQQLAQLTGASVAASRTPVGAAERGGRWLLDAVVGAVRGVLPWSESVLAAYPGVLAIRQVGSQIALQMALDSVAPGDIISLTRDITLSSPLILKRNATIYGNGYAIDGGNSTYLMHGIGGGTVVNLVGYDITFRNGQSFDPQAYATGLNTNSLNLSGSKVKFEGNKSITDYSTGAMVAIGAAIYGGGAIHLADSSFVNNDTQISPNLRGRLLSGFSGVEPLHDIRTEGTAIFAAGGDIHLLDTTFSNNLYPQYSRAGTNGWRTSFIEARDAQLISLKNNVKLYVTGGNQNFGSISSGSVARPVLGVRSGTLTEGTDGSVNFTLNAALPYPIEFSYTIGSQTNTAVFPHNTTTDAVDISAPDDSLYNPGQTISARVNSGRVYLGGTTNATINIADDEPLVSFASSTATLTEGGSTILTLNLDKPAPRPFAIAYNVSGTATAGDDFQVLSGNASVSQGSTSATIEIDSLDDFNLESDKTIVLTLPDTTTNYGVNSSAKTVTVTIEDDE